MKDRYDDNWSEKIGSRTRFRVIEALSAWTNVVISMPISVRIVASSILLAIVAVLDDVTGSEISFSLFYLFPVASACIFVSRSFGLVMAFTSAVIWGCLDVKMGQVYSAVWIQFWNSGVRLGFFIIVNELIDLLHNEHEKVRQLSRTDSLTGLANSGVFKERTYQVMTQSRRDGQPFTITYVDLDRFKLVNDRFGHSEGDRLLKTMASLLEDGVRTTDVVARLGGDEFAILMPNTGKENALEALHRIAATFTSRFEEYWNVGATFGAVTFKEPPADVDAAISNADALMYLGKTEGRGRIMHAIWPEHMTNQDMS